MSNFLEKMKNGEIKIGENAEVQLTEDLQSLVAGGVSPEEVEEEDTNFCIVIKF